MSLRNQVIENKEAQVTQLSNDFSESDAMFFTEYRGLTVTQLQEFRQTIRKSNAKYKVIKNSLIQRMFNSENVECPKELLKGPTALVISKQDCPKVASDMVKFLKSNEAFVIENGERIAQLIIAKHERAVWLEADELSETSRGEGGFGYDSIFMPDSLGLTYAQMDTIQKNSMSHRFKALKKMKTFLVPYFKKRRAYRF